MSEEYQSLADQSPNGDTEEYDCRLRTARGTRPQECNEAARHTTAHMMPPNPPRNTRLVGAPPRQGTASPEDHTSCDSAIKAVSVAGTAGRCDGDWRLEIEGCTSRSNTRNAKARTSDSVSCRSASAKWLCSAAGTARSEWYARDESIDANGARLGTDTKSWLSIATSVLMPLCLRERQFVDGRLKDWGWRVASKGRREPTVRTGRAGEMGSSQGSCLRGQEAEEGFQSGCWRFEKQLGGRTWRVQDGWWALGANGSSWDGTDCHPKEVGGGQIPAAHSLRVTISPANRFCPPTTTLQPIVLVRYCLPVAVPRCRVTVQSNGREQRYEEAVWGYSME